MKGEGTDVGTTFRSGSSYTIEELADLARRGMEAAGLTQSEVAGVLNERGNVLGLMPHPEHAVEGQIGGVDGLVVLGSLCDAVRRAGGRA